MPDAAVITTDFVRGVSVVRCSGEIDMSTAPGLHEAVDLLLGHRPPALVIDMGSVQFLGSAGIAVLVATAQAVAQIGSVFAVVATTRAVLRALEVTGVDTMLPLFATVDDAVDGSALVPSPATPPSTQPDPGVDDQRCEAEACRYARTASPRSWTRCLPCSRAALSGSFRIFSTSSKTTSRMSSSERSSIIGSPSMRSLMSNAVRSDRTRSSR